MATVTPLASLQQENKIMSELLDLLKQEQQHLVVADIDQLTALTTEKSAMIGQMAMLAAQRHRALGQAGFAAEESGMDGWIAASGDGAAAASLWQALLAQTHEAKDLNRINGLLINKHISHTQGALQALRPQSASPNNFYGPSGMATTSAKSRGFLAG